MTATYQEIPLKDIVLSGDNQRNINVKDERFLELKASIEAGGVRVPIIVHKNGKGFVLSAGERRYQACNALGLKTIPAVVHEKLEDEDALDVMYIENQFRDNLKPWEEAMQVMQYMDRLGGDAKRIAAKIGKSEGWVRKRAYIATGLVKSWKNIFVNPNVDPRFQSWTLSHLLQIARLPGHLQEQVYEQYRPNWMRPQSVSAEELNENIAAMMHLLSKCKWNLDDETLCPKAGACSTCTQRTGHQPMLWYDSDDQAQAGDECLDPECWRAKQGAWLARRAKELRENHPKLILVAKGYPQGHEAEAIAKNVGTYLSDWDYKVVGKSARGAEPAMYVYGKSAGQLTYIQRTSRESTVGKFKGVSTPLKERRAQLNAKRWAQVLIDLKEKVEGSTSEDVTLEDKVTGLMGLVACFGNSKRWSANAAVNVKDIEKLMKAKNGQAKALEMLWQSFIPTLREMLTWSGPITKTPITLCEDAKWIAKLIGLGAIKMFEDVSQRKGFTEPKSWSTLNADGTPKSEMHEKKKKKALKD
ncbi:MAG: ParB/RepB/Spo0J family partition protein [Sedimentisphaerales bacterium]|nr:ParB/RepB/Spo0J family partition protein [Sedimentisphaerales bacterium]